MVRALKRLQAVAEHQKVVPKMVEDLNDPDEVLLNEVMDDYYRYGK